MNYGGAWYNAPQPLNTFTSNFEFQYENISGPVDEDGNLGTDGIRFTLQEDGTADTSRLGRTGPYLAVEFIALRESGYDNDPQSSDVYIVKNGIVVSDVGVEPAFVYRNSTPFVASVAYNGISLNVSLDGTPVSSTPLSLADMPTGYVGFTGFDSNDVANQYINSWSFSSGPSPAITVPAGTTYPIGAHAGSGVSVQVIAGITIDPGGVAIVAPAPMNANRQLLVITAPGLSIAGSSGHWTGLLDLTNNDMDLPGGSLATTTDQIRQGYNLAGGGNWAGTGGITSSAAAGDSSHLTALGVIQNNQSGSPLYTAANPFDTYTPGAGDILVKYTYFGDANLDGKVDGSDYSLIDAGYASQGLLTGWYNGDFNYDGVVDGSDYALIDNAFNNQTANLSTAALVAESTAQVGATPVAVPEPGSLSLAAVGCVGLLRRRRRK
jgi:hypothetical protein